jgi:glycosyltransferase involved in cell wall biosynthesis
MAGRARNEAIRTADLIINVSGVLRDPSALDRRGTLCFIDSDPVFTQVKLARGQVDFRADVNAHDVHFTFGEALSDAVPHTGHDWLPTRQPILVDEWSHRGHDSGRYTTVMNWTSYNDVQFEGQRYGQKDTEFRRFLELPGRTRARLEIAMASGKNARPPIGLLERHGWSIVNPAVVAADLDRYRTYVQSSRAEWSVAKNGYVVGRPGWFSCRSACYLAAGRPVVAQDTGFGEVLPLGEGLFAFNSIGEAADAIDRIESDYRRHANAARELAVEYFESSRVLGSLVERALNPQPSGVAREADVGHAVHPLSDTRRSVEQLSPMSEQRHASSTE